MDKLFSRGVSAIIMAHPHYAAKIAAGIQKNGRHIPEDVSLITERVPSFSDFAIPPHTTIELDFEKTALAAVDQMLLLLQEKPVPVSIKIPNFTLGGFRVLNRDLF